MAAVWYQAVGSGPDTSPGLGSEHVSETSGQCVELPGEVGCRPGESRPAGGGLQTGRARATAGDHREGGNRGAFKKMSRRVKALTGP